MRTQLLRHRHVVVHADRVEEVDAGYVEEGLGPNVDEEVVVEEDREDDLKQLVLMTTVKTMKLAK